MGVSERRSALKWLKESPGRRYLVNCDILTTGYNYPALECVVMLRATTSLGLLVQILGRLIRPFGDKIGYFIDYGTNLDRLLPHGLTKIMPPRPKLKKEDAPQKACLVQSCQKYNPMNARKCIKCGAVFVFAESEDGNYFMRTQAEIIAIAAEREKKTLTCTGVMLDMGISKGGDEMVLAKYYDGYKLVHTEYLLFDHSGYAKVKAQRWLLDALKEQSDYYELDAEDGGASCENVYALLCGFPELLKPVDSIVVRPQAENKRFMEMVKVIYA
jgi:DNA repair protein RadD